jgi:hypothetical protein
MQERLKLRKEQDNGLTLVRKARTLRESKIEVRADKNINGEGARRIVFYSGHGDTAGVRKFEQFCGAVREIAAAQ